MNWDDIRKLVQDRMRKPGLKSRIEAKCIDCIVDPLAPGSWRVQVGNCNSLTCPLHDVRPRSSTQ